MSLDSIKMIWVNEKIEWEQSRDPFNLSIQCLGCCVTFSSFRLSRAVTTTNECVLDPKESGLSLRIFQGWGIQERQCSSSVLINTIGLQLPSLSLASPPFSLISSALLTWTHGPAGHLRTPQRWRRAIELYDHRYPAFSQLIYNSFQNKLVELRTRRMLQFDFWDCCAVNFYRNLTTSTPDMPIKLQPLFLL